MLNTAQKKEIAQLYSRIDRGTASDEDWERFEAGMESNPDFKAFWLTLDTVTSEALVEPTPENSQQAEELRRVAKQMADGDYIPTITETPTSKPWYLGWIMGAVLLCVVGFWFFYPEPIHTPIATVVKNKQDTSKGAVDDVATNTPGKAIPPGETTPNVGKTDKTSPLEDFREQIKPQQVKYDTIVALIARCEKCKKQGYDEALPIYNANGAMTLESVDKTFNKLIQQANKSPEDAIKLAEISLQINSLGSKLDEAIAELREYEDDCRRAFRN